MTQNRVRVEISEHARGVYETSDIVHAAILRTMGMKFMGVGVRTEHVRNRVRTRTVFQIECPEDQLQQIIADIMNEKVEGNLVAFAKHLRDLKTISHNNPAMQGE